MSFIDGMLKKMKLNVFCYCVGSLLLIFTNACFSQTIKIYPNTVIAYPKTYNNVTLDLSNGSFIIKDHATLTIKNSVINGTLSKHNPILVTIDSGKLNLQDNQVNITTSNLPQHPRTQSLEYVVQVALGSVNLTGNKFTIDNPFTAGLLITTSTIPTTGFQIEHNKFEKFHGVLYLIASDNALVSDNEFVKNSYGHIVMIGNDSKIIHNTMFFSGNDQLGNSIDIIDSNNITISKNVLFTPTCHGIYVLNSHNMVIDSNRISGGITYAMNVLSFPETIGITDEYVTKIVSNHKMKNTISNNITITNNYMSQNRYGIAISDTDELVVKNNFFIQRFEDNKSRKFWTNNNILLRNVTHLIWQNNLYKEAFTQAEGGDNSQSAKFVSFPQNGGVSL